MLSKSLSVRSDLSGHADVVVREGAGKRAVGGSRSRARRVARKRLARGRSAGPTEHAAEEQTTIAKRRQVELPRLVSQIRGDLDWVVMKCLEKDRGRRYETANGVGTEIERFLKNEPVIARPPSTLYRLQKSVRRNKIAGL